MRSLLWTIVLTLLQSFVVAGESSPWPRFRGPDGSGVAEGAKPPTEIGPETNVKWKVAVPSGLSSPIVVGDYVVVTGFDDGKLFTIAYRRSDGAEAWRADARATEIETYHKVESSPAASSPATDGERIVAYFGSCGVVCYDLAGKELWRHEMPVAQTGAGFGSSVSPIISEGLVVVVRDEFKDPVVLALDVKTGAVRWQNKRTPSMSFSTPIVWETPGGKHVVMAGHARMAGYDLSTGEEKWSALGVPAACCASPVTADGLLLFAGTMTSSGDD